MSWRDIDQAFGRLVRQVVAVGAAGLTAACFQPLYGERSPVGSSIVRDALAAVDVVEIKAPKGSLEERLAVEIRNELLFGLTGGSGSAPPTHRLEIQIASTRSAVIVDVTTGRPEFENYGLDSTYTLSEVATGKPVLKGSAFARVSYDVPGQQQRFAKRRGSRDAENRAAKVISEQIKNRLASYFVAGT